MAAEAQRFVERTGRRRHGDQGTIPGAYGRLAAERQDAGVGSPSLTRRGQCRMASGTGYGNWKVELVYPEVDVFQNWVGYWPSMVESLENSGVAHYIVAETIRVRGSRILMVRLGMHHRGGQVSGVVGGGTSGIDTYH